MIVDHAGCLHECVADRRADEFESASQQIAAHGVGFGSARGTSANVRQTILDWLAANKAPEISVEGSEFFFNGEKFFAFSIVAAIFNRFRTIPSLRSNR